VPAGIVEHEDAVALAPRTGLLGEGGEWRREEGLREAGGGMPDRLAAGRLHEGDDVQPPEAVVPERDRPPARRRPDPAADRRQAEAARGRGLAAAMFAALRERLPGREGVLFIRRDNAASLRAHARMGMREVAGFAHGGAEMAVLAYVG